RPVARTIGPPAPSPRLPEERPRPKSPLSKPLGTLVAASRRYPAGAHGRYGGFLVGRESGSAVRTPTISYNRVARSDHADCSEVRGPGDTSTPAVQRAIREGKGMARRQPTTRDQQSGTTSEGAAPPANGNGHVGYDPRPLLAALKGLKKGDFGV